MIANENKIEKKEEEFKKMEKEQKIKIRSLNHNFKTTPASLRHALIKKGIYLPDHRKNYTSVGYMKKIISTPGTFLYRT